MDNSVNPYQEQLDRSLQRIGVVSKVRVAALMLAAFVGAIVFFYTRVQGTEAALPAGILVCLYILVALILVIAAASFARIPMVIRHNGIVKKYNRENRVRKN